MRRKKKTEEERRIEFWFGMTGSAFILFTLIFSQIQSLYADEMVFKFKSPSFSGIGTSSHYLTIENQQFNRKEALKE